MVTVIAPPNTHVADRMRRLFAAANGVTVEPPCSHRRLIEHMLGCDLMLSDSGGVQEEAATLGVPLLILRENSERPECIVNGNARLVGTDPVRIATSVRDILSDPEAHAAMAIPCQLYGDGRAGERIARIIHDRLVSGQAPPRPLRWTAR